MKNGLEQVVSSKNGTGNNGTNGKLGKIGTFSILWLKICMGWGLWVQD